MYTQEAADFFSASCESSIKHTPRWLALGPAAVEKHVDSAYRAALEDEIAGPFIPGSCGDEPVDLQWEDGWKGDVAGITLWAIVSVGLLAMFLLLRSHQPLRFRSQGSITSHWAALSVIVVAVHLLHSMGFTAPCELEVVAVVLLLPAVLVFYILKTAHLIFIYQWTLAKSKDDMWQVNRFFRFRHFVSDQFYFLIQAILLVVNAVSAFSYLQAEDMNGNMFASLRCKWWEIPEQYQTPQVSTDVCYCAFDLFGSSCDAAIQAACVDGTDPNFGGVVDSDGETICSTADKHAWQQDVVTSGVCGFFSRTPDLDSCQMCMMGDRAMLMPWLIELCVLLVILVVLATIARHKHDAMLVQVESTLAAVAVLPIIGYNIARVGFESVQDKHFQVLGYDINHFVLLLYCWWCLLISFAYPLVVASRNSPDVLCKLSETVASSEDHTARATGEYTDDLHQLQFVLDNPNARLIFLDYSTATFTVENIRFLTALYDAHRYLLDNFHKHSALRKEIRDNSMRMLYTNYIQVGAALEVNISDKTRKEVMQHYESHFPNLKKKTTAAEGFGEDNWKGLLGTIEQAAAGERARTSSLSGAPSPTMLQTDFQPQSKPGAPKAKAAARTAPKASAFDTDFTKFAQDMLGGILELEEKEKTVPSKPTTPATTPVAKASGLDADFTKFAQDMLGGILELEEKQKTEKAAGPVLKIPAPISTATTHRASGTGPDSPMTDATDELCPESNAGAGAGAPSKPGSQTKRPSSKLHATRNGSLVSVESRDEDDADEVVEWLRPAIVEVTNLILKDTWGRFKRSTYYDTFYELFIASTRLGRAVQNMMSDEERGRPHLSIVQIMNPHTPNGRLSMDKGSPRHGFLNAFRRFDSRMLHSSTSKSEIELREKPRLSNNV